MQTFAGAGALERIYVGGLEITYLLMYSWTRPHRRRFRNKRYNATLFRSSQTLLYSLSLSRFILNNNNKQRKVSSHQPAPSPSLCYLLTHVHRTLPTPTLITITCTQVLGFLECLTRTTVSSCETTRTRLTICVPAQPSVCEAF
jgi:hypothetical protein